MQKGKMLEPTIHAYGLTSGPRSFLQLFTKPGPFQYAIHLERLNELKVSVFDYVPMMDHFYLEADYLGFKLKIEDDFEGALYLVAPIEMPKEHFLVICKHIDSFDKTSFIENIKARLKYKKTNKKA